MSALSTEQRLEQMESYVARVTALRLEVHIAFEHRGDPAACRVIVCRDFGRTADSIERHRDWLTRRTSGDLS